MKAMKNILSILFLGLIATTVCSCDDEIDYSPGEQSPFAELLVHNIPYQERCLRLFPNG